MAYLMDDYEAHDLYKKKAELPYIDYGVDKTGVDLQTEQGFKMLVDDNWKGE